MRYWILAISLLFAAMLGCNHSKTSNKLLDTNHLPLQEYTIDISRDTVLVTKNGALLKIPKGSLTTGNGNTVTLEIKEAYSMQQMIQAGLTTQSDGQPLSSGGMIYINAAGGQNVTITQPIQVALPTDYLSNNMQLFKGVKDENGNINWKDPASLPENKQLASIEKGQALFQSKCASCHGIGKDMKGPDLAHVIKRFAETGQEGANYFDHTYVLGRNNDSMRPDTIKPDTSTDYNYYYDQHYTAFNIYKCNLIRKYGWERPFLHTDTSGNAFLDIYRFVQNESDRMDLPLPRHAYLFDCADSCAVYKQTIYGLQSQKINALEKKDRLKNENGPLVDEKKITTPPAINDETRVPPTVVDFENRVSPQYIESEYYQFTIETFGWFNIDVLLKGVNGVEESELFVRITGEYREKIKVYLIIPSVKVYVEGGPAQRNADEFAFYLKDGKISLPQNAKAYIMAVTEAEESIAFALKEFTTAIKQEFEISLTRSTKDDFNVAVSGLSSDGINIKVADSKNAAEVRKTNADLQSIDRELKNAENLKPKNCDCECGDEGTTTITNSIDTSKTLE